MCPHLVISNRLIHRYQTEYYIILRNIDDKNTTSKKISSRCMNRWGTNNRWVFFRSYFSVVKLSLLYRMIIQLQLLEEQSPPFISMSIEKTIMWLETIKSRSLFCIKEMNSSDQYSEQGNLLMGLNNKTVLLMISPQ